MGKIYITGDCHGAFKKIEIFCRQYKTTCEDVMIILGDAGINFCLSKWDKRNKSLLTNLELTFLCIHGNHEARPESLDTYKEKMWNGGSVYFEEEYPNILFAKDGEIYELNGKKVNTLKVQMHKEKRGVTHVSSLFALSNILKLVVE